MIFTWSGSYQLDKAKFVLDEGPLEEGCSCWVCKNHTRAYIRHLSSVKEAEGMRLRQAHNLHFMMTLMSRIRDSIGNGCFEEFKQNFFDSWFKGKIPKIYK